MKAANCCELCGVGACLDRIAGVCVFVVVGIDVGEERQ